MTTKKKDEPMTPTQVGLMTALRRRELLNSVFQPCAFRRFDGRTFRSMIIRGLIRSEMYHVNIEIKDVELGREALRLYWVTELGRKAAKGLNL